MAAVFGILLRRRMNSCEYGGGGEALLSLECWPVGYSYLDDWSPASFLAMLTEPQRSDLLRRGCERPFDSGLTLMNQGDEGDSVALVLDGVVKVSMVLAGGQETLLGLRSRGDLLGEMAVVSGIPRTARVVAATRVRVRVLTGVEFVGYLERWPAAARQVAATVSRKLRAANERRAEFMAYSAAERVVVILCETAARAGRPDVGGGVLIGPEITQADLASLSAVSVSTIEKVLQSLEQDGLVERHRRALIVTDPPGLGKRSVSGAANPYWAGSPA
jgi:CRP/FNR family cyclic AMP-dependent transcriptional regulator